MYRSIGCSDEILNVVRGLPFSSLPAFQLPSTQIIDRRHMTQSKFVPSPRPARTLSKDQEADFNV
jgi:hypothetical protein